MHSFAEWNRALVFFHDSLGYSNERRRNSTPDTYLSKSTFPSLAGCYGSRIESEKNASDHGRRTARMFVLLVNLKGHLHPSYH